MLSGSGSQVEPDEDPLGVGQVADDLADRSREPPDQGRDGDDLVPPGPPRVHQQVDDLDLVAMTEVGLAELLEVGERLERLG